MANIRGPVAVVALLLTLILPPAVASEDSEPKIFQGMEFRGIGPFRGGRSTTVAGVPGDPMTYYFGSTGGGLWRTEDAGLNWQAITDGKVKTGSVGAVAVAPSDANVIWLGMGEAPVRGVMTTHGDGVYRSTDRGQTWQYLGLANSHHIARIRVHPDDPDTAWVAVQGRLYGASEDRGIYKTRDGGQTWRKVLFVDADTGASDLTLDATNPRILYAATWQHRRYPWKVESGGAGSGLWKSVDGGENWKRLGKGLPRVMGKIGVSVSAADPSRVYAIIESEKGGLYRSDDGGKKWKMINDKRVLRARSWYYMHVFADPNDADTVFVLNAPMLKSVDGGKHFDRIATPHGDNHDLWIHPENSNWMINANDGGANVSFNGGKSWSTQTNQSTAQFYRVITDDQFPYRVYGGQQDNSAISIQSRSMAGVIDRRHWHSISGCESAWPAFDPDDPRYIYAGCYQGIISEYDTLNHTEREVMAYPYLGLGAEPGSVKYRFNWNAPIIASPHDPKVIYHAGNQVLRTSDRGRNWTPVSPDLTRNNAEHLGPGGGPITNEAAGGENWHTIASMVESIHQPGEIWVGTDDGRVHVTRDSGDQWTEVTPPRIGEALVNAIDISPHNRDTVRLAVTGYKHNDYSPLILVTRDGGKSWKKTIRGLPDDLIVRAVREDLKRPGLLFAGTEAGVWFSLDDGGQWQALKLNLPAVPVTDLTIHDQDLVIATQGRGFWILDNIEPLRQWPDEPEVSPLHLFDPRGGYRTGGFQNENPRHAGTNAPNGVILDFLVDKALIPPDQAPADDDESSPPLVLEILDLDGKLIRRISSEKPDDKDATRLSARAGHNRFVWDLRHDRVRYLKDTQEFPDWSGPRVVPGPYLARLSHGELSVQQQFQVWPDPRKQIQDKYFVEHQRFLDAIYQRVNAIHTTVLALRDARGQVQSLMKRVKGHSAEESINEAGKALTEAITELEEQLIQPRQKTQQDIVNFPSKLNAEYLWLMALTDDADPPLNQGARDRLADLDSIWDQHQAAYQALIEGEMTAFNQLFDTHQIPAVIIERD
jgi:photosystem II stability/assembly factor-like uncharacterized protein